MPVPRSYSFCTCDVFTDRRFGGNQLAVVLEADDLPADQMQAIAREFNYSETVFVLPPSSPAHTARARIFTPARELRFAGHPTIGTAFVLATCRPALAGAERIVLEEGVGPVSISVERDGTQIRRCVFAAPTLPQAGPPAPPRDALAAMLGLAPLEVLDSAESWSCGMGFLVVPVSSVAALERCRLDIAVWSSTLAAWESKHVYPVAQAGAAWRVRMFAPDAGVPEDPATGSAAAAFAGWLAHYAPQAARRSHYTLLQGQEIGRPSRLDVTIDRDGERVTQVQVGGSSVMVSQGTLLA
ncbi:MAG: PhzF family phenazine biosynthesis protein [Burkholderiaceae bacterium]|nr:PhzF family phenazine biosynthesis protein [Burkholderiaceae bacterium]